jgi:PKD repeat protein
MKHRGYGKFRSSLSGNVRVLLVFISAALLALSPSSLGAAPARALQTPSGGTKVMVDSSDRATINELTKGGATLLADYGAFGLWSVSSAQRSSLVGRSSVIARADFDTIALRGGSSIDTRAGAPSVPAGLRQTRTSGEQFWMLQFIGPTKDSWLDQVRALGVQIVMYMPNNAYVVWGDKAALDGLDKLVGQGAVVQWTGAYHPAYRLEPSLQQAIQGQPADKLLDVTVQIYDSKSLGKSLANLQALGRQVLQQPEQILNFTNISLQLPAGQIAAVAGWADVFNVEPWAAPVKLDEKQGLIVAGQVTTSAGHVVPAAPGYLAWLAAQGFPTTPASYPIVDVTDDGIDNGNAANVLHPDFHELGVLANPDRVSYIGNCTTDANGNGVAGHGNLNAGIVAAYNNQTGAPYVDADGYRIGLGISPYGRVAGTKVFRNSGTFDNSVCGGTNAGQVAAAFNNGAALTSNSWGSTTLLGTYTSTSQAYDALTRDASSTAAGNQQMLHVFAAGNAGPGATTVSAPGTGKNVLTVGATENVRDNGISDGCDEPAADSADDIADFSARGPTTDSRAKPDITAPGTHVQGPASQTAGFDGSGVCGAPGNDFLPPGTDAYYPTGGQTLYTWSSGTSHSTPAVAGAASLLYEYYGRVLRPGQVPSPAMLKALLVNTPRYLTGLNANDTLPSRTQGWGDVNLGSTFDSAARFLVDQTAVLGATGQVYTTSGTIPDASKPFHVSLAWTDAPGSTTGNAFVNDLDLEVVVGGTTYRGNVFSGANSTPGGSFDPRDNIENVFVPAGAGGTFAVRVIARNIAGDGVPQNADTTDQDFALVIYNANNTPVTVLGPGQISWTDGGGDTVADPGDTVNLQIDLVNSGELAATNVSGVVSPVSGAVTMIDATSAYPDIPAGATKTNSTPYRFSVSPNQPCGTPVVFNQTVTYNGGLTFTHTFTIPIGVQPVTNGSYSGPPIPIPDNNPTGATASINITAAGTVGDVDVRFDAIHPFDADLDIFLISPAGTQVELSTDNGGSGDNYTGTIFDDEAAGSITGGTSPFTGRFRPEQPLSALDGQPISGTWRLKAVDDAGADIGSITGFALTIQGAEPSCPLVRVTATNDSPTSLGQPTTFQATAVPSSTLTTFAWNFGDGSTGSGATVAHTYAATGTYTATVTATNLRGSLSATTTAVVVDQGITGLEAHNNSPTPLGAATTLSATITAGTNVTYAWNFGDGATGSGATVTHTYGEPGTYTATVTASNSGGSATATTSVVVQDVPIAGLTATNNSPTTLGSQTTLRATIRAGTNVTYAWDFGDDTSGTGATVNHVYGAPGTYLATVTATNSRGTETATTLVHVQDALITGLSARNNSPTVVGQTTNLTATVATGTNVTYTWDFGDGTLGIGAVKTHRYAAAGTYQATVTATNSRGTVVASTTVTIVAQDKPIKGLKASNDGPTKLGRTTTLRAKIDKGTNVTYTWDFGDGTTGTGATVTHVYATTGTFTARVTARNNSSSATATTSVKVKK